MLNLMAKKKTQIDSTDALKETLASFACEGIFFSDEEKALLKQMEAQGVSDEERMAQIDAWLRERR